MENQTQPAELKNSKFNLFKILQNVAVVGIFLVIGLICLFATSMLPRSITSIEFTIIVGLILAGVLLVLPWAKYLEQKEYKVVSLVFLIGNAVCTLLWVICTFIICAAVRYENASTGMLHLIRITLLISMQIIIASFIGKFIIKYRTKYIPFQAITYLSLIYIDLWLSILLFGVSINKGLIVEHAVFDIVWNRTAGALMILACIYVITAVTLINNARHRRVRNKILGGARNVNKDIGILDYDDDDYDDKQKKTASSAVINDTEVQLEKLKSMLDKGLITQAEYDTKRKDIIDKM